MLALRPTCEHCDTALPASSDQARICSFECTFCAACVDELLGNVCPNCGGGFAPRPIRPANDRRGGNYLGKYPASPERKHRPVDLSAHQAFVRSLAGIDPRDR